MAKKKKNHKDRSDAPVSTGHDYRGKEKAGQGPAQQIARPEAPDGISGCWG